MNIIESNNNLYLLIRDIKKEVFKSKDDIKLYKDYIKVDHVLQHKNKYLFVRNIDDAEYEII